MKNIIVGETQEYRGRQTEFDADSSPQAWAYYRKVYPTGDWTLKDDFDLVHLYKQGGRLAAKLTSGNPLRETMGPEFKIAGDTDFNFNAKHYPLFEKILKSEGASLQQLNICAAQHHSLANFSLMPVTGGLNNFKGARYRWDRFDTFLFNLNQYYQFGQQNIINYGRVSNRTCKREYMDKFKSVYDYCRQIYFIEDEHFVNDLVKNGSQRIASVADVERYLDFAMRYWEMKEEVISRL